MKTQQPFSIVIADDHILLRDSLSGLIDSFENFAVSGVAGDGKQLVEILRQVDEPDIVILDLSMPVMDGYETASWLYKNHPKIKTLILSMYDSDIALIRLLKSGVRGFLKKDIHPEELKKALEAVAGDGYYYSQDTTGKLANFFQKTLNNKNLLEKTLLTDAEIKFLKLASSDKTYKEIAAEMKITPRAIDGYRDSLFEKLNVKSRVGLAIYAVKTGLVTF